MSCHRLSPHPARRASQRGGVLLVVVLSLTVLIGMMGLAVDAGRLYVAKTELQNAADACALAASRELAGSVAADAFARADAAGKLLGSRHKVDFQGSALAAGDFALTYSASLDGPWSAAGSAAGTARMVRCSVTKSALQPWVLQVLGVGAQSLSASASAALQTGQFGNALPLGVCAQTNAAPNYGLSSGQWLWSYFQVSGGATVTYYWNAVMRWIDFDPSRTAPGCSTGTELACQLAGTGQSSAPVPTAGACTTSGTAVPSSGCVALTTAASGLNAAFNSRFGLYNGSHSLATAPPDHTGYSYEESNWGSSSGAYSGSWGGDAQLPHCASSAPCECCSANRVFCEYVGSAPGRGR